MNQSTWHRAATRQAETRLRGGEVDNGGKMTSNNELHGPRLNRMFCRQCGQEVEGTKCERCQP